MAQAYSFKIDPSEPFIEFPALVKRTCCIAPITFTLLSVTRGGNDVTSLFTMVDESDDPITEFILTGERGTIRFMYDTNDPANPAIDDPPYLFDFNVTSDCKGDGNVLSENYRTAAVFTGIGTDGPCTPGPYYMNFNFNYKNGRFSEDMVVTPSSTIEITGISVGNKISRVTVFTSPTGPGTELYPNTANLNNQYTLTNRTLTVEVDYVGGYPVAPSQSASMSDMIGYAVQIEYS